ncbi:hypothetical protein COE79_11505 [Bacillus toyonensis]|uniref:YncE family protein n=1 Tax=Bacillus TaxID=1386 RepID=UPI000BFE0350|nr:MULTISPECIES: hypothetical protein [Bacillus]MBY7136968.1 hypothetical protein [Bacillus sp. 12RED03]PHB00781.1 hypothetical protein COE79_11505 [Bacillus toyonensis]
MQHLQIHILVGTSPRRVGVNPLTNRIYIANVTSNNVSVIDRITNTVITTILGFSSPFGIGVNP